VNTVDPTATGQAGRPSIASAPLPDTDLSTRADVEALLHSGAVTGVTLIEPPGPCWPLPLYELALLTAKHTRDRGLPVEITLATPHPHPLYPFGDSVGATMQRLLQAVGVAVHLRTSVQFLGPQSVRLTPADLPIKQGGLAGWLAAQQADVAAGLGAYLSEHPPAG